MEGTLARAATLLFVLCCSTPALAHEKTPPSQATSTVAGSLGATNFPNSGAAAAQPDFMRGLLLLHSFEFDAARTSFRAAQAQDPGFVMAYWGEALSHNRPIWGEQDLEAARAVLQRLGPTREARLAKAPTERERGYLESVEALYGDGAKVERDASFNRALGELAQKFPDDLDARSFYALSWLGLTGSTRNTANYMRAAAEAEAVYEIDPRHPGALHYLVHAYDDPVHAPLGLRAARRYGKVAPAAAHAQHMPSHIFFALGMWDDAIEANVASLATARSHGQGGYHALEWLEYAYLQQGMREDAAQLVKSVEDEVARKPTAGNRTSLAYDRALWLVETGSAGPAGWADVDETGIKAIHAFSAYDFARGVVAARSGNVPAAEAQVRRLRARTDAARANAVGVVASRYDSVTPEELEQGQILASALEGVILFAQGKRDDGLGRVREAIARSDAMAFEYGPPYSVKPLDELLGDLLLTAGKPAEAAAAYRKTLAVHPNRRLAVAGLDAARQAGRQP